MTIFLRFKDEAEARKVLAAFLLRTDAGIDLWQTDSHEHSLQILGTVRRETGVMLKTAEGLVPETEPVPGFHVNAKFKEMPPELAAYQVYPTSPSCVFFGDEV